MGQHFSDKLHSCSVIMNSDEDQPMVMDIHVGFTSQNELAVSVDYSNYEDPRYNCSTVALVGYEDGVRLSKRHNIRYEDLPQFISDCMEEWKEIVNPTLNQVRECFKEITECLLDEGCHFKIERTYGKNDYICC